MRNRNPLAPVVLALVALLVQPPEAAAIQIHGPPEGLYAHLIAHFVFFCALAFLLWTLEKRPLDASPGWRYLKLALVFFLLWNADTFVVHLFSLHLPEHALATGSSRLWEHRLNAPLDWERLLFYLGRFDHLLCVPAMACLARSLTLFAAEAEGRRTRNEEGAP